MTDKGYAAKRGIPFSLSKKSSGFFDRLQNAVTFVPTSGTKVLALRAESLALPIGVPGETQRQRFRWGAQEHRNEQVFVLAQKREIWRL